MKVLVAEDDHHMRLGILELLEQEGYETVGAGDGQAALDLYAAEAPDFVCLDIMMPKMSGYDVCREIRRGNGTIPIIFLSAKSEEIDKVLGLELGADDYIMKPFGRKELIARIRAVCRRCLSAEGAVPQQAFQMGDLLVHPAELRARRGPALIELSLREVKLLRCFAEHRGAVLDRDHLFRECWGIDHYPNSRTLDQHISKLRKKVEPDPRAPTLIKTVHGAGYRFDG